jgi:hypothetical protein
MADSTGPIPSFQYFGRQADQLISNAGSHLHSAFDRVRMAISSLSNAARSASYGLRQEVPFERWFFDHGFQAPLVSTSDLIKARVWAFVVTCEGLVRSAAEAVSYVFSRIFDSGNSDRHLEVLRAQWQGLSLSLLAIISPNAAKQKAYNEGTSLIGASLLDWRWGSLYVGKVDAPFWQVECRYYPWADTANPSFNPIS